MTRRPRRANCIWLLSDNWIHVKGKDIEQENSVVRRYLASVTNIKNSIIKLYFKDLGVTTVATKARTGDVIVIVCSTMDFYKLATSHFENIVGLFPIYVFVDYNETNDYNAVPFMKDIDMLGNSFLPLRLLYVENTPGFISKILIIANYCLNNISPYLTDDGFNSFPNFRLFCMGDLHIGGLSMSDGLAEAISKLPNSVLPDSVAFLGDIFHQGGLKPHLIEKAEILLNSISNIIRSKNLTAPVVCVFGDHDMENNEEAHRKDNTIPFHVNTTNLTKIFDGLPDNIWSGYSKNDKNKIHKVRVEKPIDDSDNSTADAITANYGINSSAGLAAAATLWDTSPSKHMVFALSDSVIPFLVKARKEIRTGNKFEPVAQELSRLLEEVNCLIEPSLILTFQHHPFTLSKEIGSMFGPRGDYDYGGGSDPYSKEFKKSKLNPGKHILIHGHVHYSHVTPDPENYRIIIGVPPLGDKAYDDDLFGFLSMNIVSMHNNKHNNKYMLFVSKHNYDGSDRFIRRMMTPSRVLMIIFETDKEGQISKIEDDVLSFKTKKIKKRRSGLDAFYVNSVDIYKYDNVANDYFTCDCQT